MEKELKKKLDENDFQTLIEESLRQAKKKGTKSVPE